MGEVATPPRAPLFSLRDHIVIDIPVLRKRIAGNDGNAMMGAPAAAPAAAGSYSGFVENFVETMKRSLGHDAVSGKRKEVMEKHAVSTANEARFALGGDNSLYLVAGMSLLHVDDAEDAEHALAPSGLYSSDVLDATKRGLASATLVENAMRRKEAPAELRALFRAMWQFAEVFVDRGLKNKPEYNLAREVVEELSKLLKSKPAPTNEQIDEEANKVATRTDFKDVMRQLAAFLFEVVSESNDKVGGLLAEVMKEKEFKDFGFQIEGQSFTSVQGGAATAGAATAGAFSPIHDDACTFAMLSGACDHVAPHEPVDPNDPRTGVDALVSFDAPRGLERSIAYASMLGKAKNEPAVRAAARELAARHVPATRHGDVAFIEATLALDGRYSLLDDDGGDGGDGGATKKRPLRWEPIGEHAEDFANAAILGHVVGRLRQVQLQTGASLSPEARRLLGHAAAVVKLRQLDSMRGVHQAVRQGTAPPVATSAGLPPLPDPPVSRARDQQEALRTVVDDARRVRDYLRILVERTLYYAFVPSDEEVRAEFDALLPGGSAKERRSGLWTEMLRELAVSTDRVWIFVRTLSGVIGEQSESLITTADEATQRAAKEVQDQRKQITERVAQMQSKLVETLVSGLLKDSSLQLSTGADAANAVVVVDGDTAKQLRDLASGESGRPFFEANVALRNLAESTRAKPTSLGAIVAEFGEIAERLKTSLEGQLLPQAGVAGATLAELAMPRNSFFVRLREDTSAAIRTAFDRFDTERGLHEIRHIYLWELIEGADQMLSSRFAEFVGHVLVQTRTSTGAAAIYASRHQIAINAAQARVALARLLNQASFYASRYGPPNFQKDGDRSSYFDASAKVHDARSVAWSSSSSSAVMLGPKRQMLNLSGWHGGLMY